MKTKKKYWQLVPSLVFIMACSVPKHDCDKELVFEENWESISKANITPEWFLDAKFGIYTHWGPVSAAFVGTEKDINYNGWHGMYMYGKNGIGNHSAAEGENNPETPSRPTKNYSHHVKQFGDPAEFGYKYLIEQFNPSGFNAKEWAELFASSGAKFAGNVAMHHDNFAMWNSSATRWNSKNYGGIDVSGKLKKEIEAQGMKYMASFHHAFTWKYYAPAHAYSEIPEEDYDLYTEPHPFGSNTPSDRFYEEWWAKLQEFIDVYQPDLLWFDWWLENMDEATRQKFLAYYYNKGTEWGKDVAVCFKETTFPDSTAIRDYERGRPNQPKKRAWLTDTSPGAWFYRPHTDFVEVGELVDILVDIVSKNGCMLLNVPPDPDGTIPGDMKNILVGMGKWLDVNGEAIYGTRTWTVFGEGPTRLEMGGHKIEENGFRYTDKDIRFTKKSDSEFYAIVLDTPEDKIVIKSLSTQLGILNNKIESIKLVGSTEQITWESNEKGVIIKAPNNYPSEYAHAFRIKLAEYQETDI